MIARIVCLIIGYCFGLFQTSYFYGMRKGIDIRKMGSGNAGTTNALRSLGKKAGIITLLGDILKCILAVFLSWLIFHNTYAELFPLLKIWTAAGVIIGHDFPFYMNFKGGKGIAATAGMILSFGDWRLILISFGCFFAVFLLTHYVSLGSILISVSFVAGMILLGWSSAFSMEHTRWIEMCVLTALLVSLNIFQHRTNIQRLMQGCERKTYLIKNKK